MPGPEVRVNLLSDRKRLLKKRRLLVAKIQLVSGVLLAVYIAVLLIVVGFRVSVSTKLGSIEKGIKQEELRLTQLRQTEALHTVLGNKLGLVDDFLANRKHLREAFEQFVSLLPEGVSLEGFAIEDAANSIEVELVSRDVFVVNELLTVLEQSVNDETYAYVSIGAFQRKNDGTYELRGSLPF